MDSQATVEGELAERYRQSVSGTIRKYTGLSFVRGQGAYLQDLAGNRYLDFAAGIATNALGYGHPEVVSAIRDQVDRMIHGGVHIGLHPPYIEMAEALKGIAPGRLRNGKVMFLNSGSEAVEAALKLARVTTGKHLVISFLGSFHGRTMGSLAATSSNPDFRRGLTGLLGGTFHAPYPMALGQTWGQLSPQERAEITLEYLEFALRTALPVEDVAAVLVEPLLGESGFVMPPRGFLTRLRTWCNRHGLLLICDEVHTGIGRSGRWFVVDHEGVEPDIMTVGKAVGGGLPLAGVIAKAELMDRWHPGGHGTTFGGNLVACAAGVATIRVIERDALLGHVQRVGQTILEVLQAELRGLPILADVRGMGLMIGVGLGEQDPDGQPGLVKTIIDIAAGMGLLVIGGGRNAIRICPPFIITNDEAMRGAQTLVAAIKKAIA